MRPSPLAAAVLAVVLVLLSVSQPATAQGVTRTDAAGDVALFDSRSAGQVDAGRTNADVRRYTLEHQGGRVRVVLGFTRLDRSDPRLELGAFLRWRQQGRLVRDEVVVRAQTGYWGGRVNPPGPDRCRVTHRIDYSKGRFVVSFPTSCLGRPAWVDVQAFAAASAPQNGDAAYLALDRVPGVGNDGVWVRLRAGRR